VGDKLNFIANYISGEEKKQEEKKKQASQPAIAKQVYVDPEKAKKFREGFNKKLGSL
jgi:hypothetical protein